MNEPRYAQTTPELVHLAILKDAAEIANAELQNDSQLQKIQEQIKQKPPKFGTNRGAVVGGSVFYPDPGRSRRGGLALAINPALGALDPEILNRLHEIGRDGIKTALIQNRHKFVGLILGMAKQGINYFDRFE